MGIRAVPFPPKAGALCDLVVVVYPSEAKAEEVRQKLFDLQKEYLIFIDDAAIATKTDAGKVKLKQIVNTTATGASAGSFWACPSSGILGQLAA